MRREDAEAKRDRLQRHDHEHTYDVREHPVGEWEVVRINLPHRTPHLVAERGKPAEVPEDPRPFIVRQIPPYGPPGIG
jgi:hypothetical protein